MDTNHFFKRFFKGDEEQDVDSVRKTRKRWIFYGASIIILIAIVIGSSCAVAAHNRKARSPNSTPSSNTELTPASSLKTVCSVTPYPDACVSSISKLPFSKTTTDPETFFKLSLQVAVDELTSISQLPKKLANGTDDESLKASLNICFTVFDDGLDSLNRTVSEMVNGKSLNSTKIHNLLTWLSTALIEHDTCNDALDEATSTDPIAQALKSAMVNSIHYTTNSLYIVSDILSPLSDIGDKQQTQKQRRRRLLNDNSNSELSPSATSLKTVCSVTPHPDSCISRISKLPSSNTTTDPVAFFKLSLQVAIDELASISQLPKKLANETENESLKASLNICFEVFDDGLDSLNRTVSEMVGYKSLNSSKIHDFQTWLSTALVEYDTCSDALDEATSTDPIAQSLKSAMVNSTEATSNSLAIVASLGDNSFPDWVRPGVRRLLEDEEDDSDSEKLVPNVTVAADGSGDVKTVNEAVQRIPNKADSYFLIYVKAGTYLENVFVGKNKWNVFMYGDGMYKTIISGSRSNGTGYKTIDSATLAIKGPGFIMKDIGIINTSGPKMGQAVAFASDSDASVYYQCSFDAYQDTLYPHCNRQFYRNCDVTGTVDFIFGYAAAVFQNCSIRPRQPLPGQSVTITAQGRTCPRENSGFSIQRCTISPNGNVTAPTYLGRPWKYWATTVVMESEIDSIVKSEGWLSWNGSDSMFYGEYKNTGPGSSVAQRVDWGVRYKSVMTDADAAKFTVASLLIGNQWLPSTGIPFSPY